MRAHSRQFSRVLTVDTSLRARSTPARCAGERSAGAGVAQQVASRSLVTAAVGLHLPHRHSQGVTSPTGILSTRHYSQPSLQGGRGGQRCHAPPRRTAASGAALSSGGSDAERRCCHRRRRCQRPPPLFIVGGFRRFVVGGVRRLWWRRWRGGVGIGGDCGGDSSDPRRGGKHPGEGRGDAAAARGRRCGYVPHGRLQGAGRGNGPRSTGPDPYE